MKIYIFYAFLIAVLTILTRFIGLDKIPPHLSNDEISIAYDAYSVSRSLRDEHNQFLPISFQSHGDYKLPLTIYLTSISVLLLGNSEYSARLPSAILGSLTVLLLGLIAYELTGSIHLALLTSGILALTPWHIYTSRMTLETNVALFFLVGGIWFFFLKIQRDKNIALIVSFLFFALSMYAYHTEWGLTPLIIIVSFLLYYKKLLVNKKAYFAGLVLFFLIGLPLLWNYFNNLGTNARANTETLFTQASLKKQLEGYKNNSFRKGQIILSHIAGTYSFYTRPDNIFFSSPNLLPKPDPWQAGLILAPFFPMFILGLFKVKKYFKTNSNFIYLWLIASPLIPALTVGEQQVMRSLPFIAPSVLIIAVGCYDLFKYRRKKVISITYAALIFVSFFYFSALYYDHFPKESGENFQYGYKQIAKFISPRYEDYKRFIIDPKFGEGYFFDGVPHLYIAYFTSLEPKYLQERSGNNPCGNCFAKYEIRTIDWLKENLQDKTIYAVPYSNRPPEGVKTRMNLLTEIKLPNQKPAFAIYEKE